MNKNTKNLNSSMLTISCCILLSRILGFIRDIVFAGNWGTGIEMDAFIIAFAIPNLLRALFGEGAFTAAFVPVFSEKLKKDGKEEAFKSAANSFSVLALILTTLVIILIIISLFCGLFIKGELSRLALRIFPWVIPYAILICLTGAFGAMLNTLKRFILPALMPIILNAVFIIFALFICPHLGNNPRTTIMGLALAVLIAGGLQLFLQYLGCYKCGFRFSFPINFRCPELKQIIFLMLPALLGTGVAQINTAVDKFLAGYLGKGAASSLYYSQRLIYLPVGLFAVAMSIVCLPAMSRAWLNKDQTAMKDTLLYSFRQVLYLTIPATILLATTASPLLTLMFQRGAYSAQSHQETMWALKFYLPAIPAFACAKLIVTPFYARKDTKTPVKIATICLVLNIILNLTLMQFLRQGGLALSSTICSYLNVGLLLFVLHKQMGNLGLRTIIIDIAKVIICGVLAGIVSLLSIKYLPNNLSGQIGKFIYALVPLTLGAITYLVSSLALKCREVKELFYPIIEKIRTKK